VAARIELFIVIFIFVSFFSAVFDCESIVVPFVMGAVLFLFRSGINATGLICW
jgi:hypothetical protein